MEDFIVARLVFWITTLFTATADDAPGIYCNSKAQTWIEAMSGCKDNGGKVVSYETDVGKPVANLSLKSDEDIWTADYATNALKGGYIELCGFVYFDSTTWVIGDTYYGDCYTERYYFCWNETTSTLDVFQSTHSGINIKCNKPVNEKDIIRQDVKPGFYWTKNIQVNIITVTEEDWLLPTYKLVWCGAYTAKIGRYFIKCDTKRHSLCQMSDNDGGSLDKSCFTEKHKSSTIEATPKSTVKTTVEPSSSETERILNTAITLYSSMENSQHTPKRNYPSTDAVANQTEVDIHKRDKSKNLAVEKHDSNLGSKVGVSVGVCLALICGITLAIYLSRRYKCWKRNDNQSNTMKSDMSTMSSQRRAIAHCNASYEPSENMIDSTITNQGTNNEWKYHGNNKTPKTDLNSEYAVVQKKNLQRQHNQRTKTEPRKENKSSFDNEETTFANANEIQTDEYSFGKEIEDVTNKNDGDLYNITEEDYDVTGNFQSNSLGTSYNVYNRLQSEEYDSSANVRGREDFNNVYGITRNGGTESVYDSTRQVGDSTHGDNIYNQLSQDTSKDEQTCYDSTSNISKIGKVKDTDQTYGKLR